MVDHSLYLGTSTFNNVTKKRVILNNLDHEQYLKNRAPPKRRNEIFFSLAIQHGQARQKTKSKSQAAK